MVGFPLFKPRYWEERQRILLMPREESEMLYRLGKLVQDIFHTHRQIGFTTYFCRLGEDHRF